MRVSPDAQPWRSRHPARNRAAQGGGAVAGRTLVLLAVLAVLATIVTLVLVDRPRSHTVERETISDTEPPPTPEVESPTRDRVELPAAPDAPTPEPGCGVSDDPALTFSGRFVMSDGSTPPSDIDFSLGPIDAGWFSEHDATDGVFRGDVDESGRYRIDEVFSGSTRLRPEPRTITVPGAPVEVTLTPVLPTVLHVVDADTGLPLPGATARVTGDHSYSGAGSWYPDTETLAGAALTADDEGRIALRYLTDEQRWMCTAPGYAWRRVVIALEVGGERRVELAHGGDLRLLIPGAARLDELFISAKLPEHGSVAHLPLPDEDGLVVLERLPAGLCRFTLRRGGRWEGGEIYGEGAVEIVSGASNTLVIEPNVRAGADRFVVTGTVVLDPAWDAASGPDFVSLGRVGRKTPRARAHVRLERGSEPNTYRFATPPLPAGRYEAALRDVSWCGDVTVSPESPVVRIVVGAPVSLVVHVVDDESGAVLPAADVLWSPVVNTERGGAHGPLQRRKDRGPAAFGRMVAPGRVELKVSAAGHKSVEQVVDVPEDAGEVETTIRLGAAGVVVVRVLVNGRPYAGEPLWADVETSRNRSTSKSTRDGTAHFTGVAVGTREVSLKGRDHIDLVPPQIVEIRPGETTEVVFEIGEEGD